METRGLTSPRTSGSTQVTNGIQLMSTPMPQNGLESAMISLVRGGRWKTRLGTQFDRDGVEPAFTKDHYGLYLSPSRESLRRVGASDSSPAETSEGSSTGGKGGKGKGAAKGPPALSLKKGQRVVLEASCSVCPVRAWGMLAAVQLEGAAVQCLDALVPSGQRTRPRFLVEALEDGVVISESTNLGVAALLA